MKANQATTYIEARPTSENTEFTQINLLGDWTIQSIVEIERQVAAFLQRREKSAPIAAKITGDEVTALDTAGAQMLLRLAHDLKASFAGFRPYHLAILDLVKTRYTEDKKLTSLVPKPSGRYEAIGKGTVEWIKHINGLLSFTGECLIGIAGVVYSAIVGRWKKLRFKEFVVQVDQVFVTAIPIVALVSALIGVVVSYLFAAQSIKYGGQIFLVDAIGIAMCRELSPIVVAIIIAGRSGSAFTAQLGTMKLNEEIDAISTLGLSPMHLLVLPRMLALMLTIPLLVFVGDIAGIAGGMLIGSTYVDITPATFLDRLQRAVAQKHIYIGFFKAPVFAMAIASIGCYMGLTTENNARSVGLSTTSTVVQSIVSVIILNAFFAVILVQLKL